MGSQRITRHTFRKLLSLWNVSDYLVTQHPHWTATLTVPGLSYDSFYYNGVPKIHSLMNLSSTARLYAFNVPYNEEGDTFMDWEVMTRDCFVFISSLKVIMSRALYDQSAQKDILAAKLYQGYIGNSSISSLIEFFHPTAEKPLFQHLNQVVTVDRYTRKPIPTPDWFKEKYKDKGVINKPFIVKPLPRPKETFVHKIQVQWSDTDMYHHTNYAAYPKFAVDSVHAALLNKGHHGCTALKDFTDRHLLNGVEEVEICYLRQSLQGDMIEIHIWQDEGNPRKIICSMCCDGVEICQIKLLYFDSE